MKDHLMDAWDEPPKPIKPADPWDDEPKQLVRRVEGDILEPHAEGDEDDLEPEDWASMTPAQLRVKGKDGMTVKQRAFVTEYIDTQGNGSEAARRVGCSEASAHVVASRWLRAPAVIAALRERIGAKYVTIAPALQAHMLKLALDSKSQFVQQMAAKDLLDRADIKPPEARGINVRVAIDLT